MEGTTKEKLMLGLQKHWKVLIVVVLAIAFLITAMLLNSSRKRQREIEEQLKRQNELVEALQEKKGIEGAKEKVVVTSDTLKEQLNGIRELVTQEYIYTNADKRESTEKWLWGIDRPFSGNSLLVTYDGTIKAGVDLSQVDISVDEEARTITVTLPKSQIVSHETFEDTLVVLDETNNVFNPISIENYTEFVSGQKAGMEQKAIDRGVLTSASQEAKTIVRSFLALLPGMDGYRLIVK